MADENKPEMEEVEELAEELEGEEEEGATLVLSDDDGVEVEFEYIGSVDYEGAEYVDQGFGVYDI